MTDAIKGKNLILVISVVAWGLALFFSAKLAAAEATMKNQDPTSAWYETEDRLDGMQAGKNHAAPKMTKSSDRASTGSDSVYSWYETEDALPKYEAKAMVKDIQANRQANETPELGLYSWYETEDALPQIY